MHAISPSLAHNATSGRAKVQQEARCRICASRARRSLPLTRHHLVPHAWFLQRREHLRVLRNANANIVPLCRDCHAVVDGRDPVPRLQKRSTLRQRLGSAETAFIIQVRGREWLDRNYPQDP